jgi:hypothetical protein
MLGYKIFDTLLISGRGKEKEKEIRRQYAPKDNCLLEMINLVII